MSTIQQKISRKLRKQKKRLALLAQVDPRERRRQQREARTEARIAEGRQAGQSSAYLRRIHSAEWKVFRMTIMAQRGAKCEQCPSVRNIQLHHMTYERLGNELPQDVMLLCDDCHRGIHGHVTPKPVKRKGKPLTPSSLWERGITEDYERAK